MSLDALLARARLDSAEFPDFLSNHAPMVMIALDRLGASEARIGEWFEQYRAANGLVDAPPPIAPISAGDWQSALGDRARETDYRQFFTREAHRLGLDGAIRRFVPTLARGVAGSALHPLMRLAYAAMTDDVEEAGAALGYWAACYLPLPVRNESACDMADPAALLAAVAHVEGARTYETETDLLWHNILAVATLPGFASAADRLAFCADTPRRMADTALALFAGTMDFAALHALTGLHWIRLVAPHLDDVEPLYRAFWLVIAALVPKIGFPDLPSAEALAQMRATPAPDWSDIRARAVTCADEHDISLVFSAWQESQFRGDPLYRIVAARRLGMIETAA